MRFDPHYGLRMLSFLIAPSGAVPYCCLASSSRNAHVRLSGDRPSQVGYGSLGHVAAKTNLVGIHAVCRFEPLARMKVYDTRVVLSTPQLHVITRGLRSFFLCLLDRLDTL